MSHRILVIEDDEDIAKLLRIHLSDQGYDVDLADDGESGVKKLSNEHYDLVVLDLKLPDIDGLEVCRRIRNQPRYSPVLILTSKSSVVDRVVGLEMGADDYVTKPFSIQELLARVKAIFRRIESIEKASAPTESEVIESGDFLVDVEKRKVALRDETLDLTAKEFDLLLQFIRHPGRVYTRSQLLGLMWGYQHAGCDHTVNSHINRLRAKTEQNPRKPEYILTVWGVGYKFREPPRAGGP